MRTHRLGFLVVPSLITALVSPAMSASWERLDSGIAPINSWTPALTDWVYPNGVELIEVFAVTSDSLHNLVMTSVFANDAGAPFPVGTINLGGNLIYPPSAVQVANADNTSHLEVFGIGTDHALYHQTNDNGAGWSGWASLGKPSAGLCSGPSAVSWSQTIDRIDVFVVGCETDCGKGGSRPARGTAGSAPTMRSASREARRSPPSRAAPSALWTSSWSTRHRSTSSTSGSTVAGTRRTSPERRRTPR